MKHFTTSSFRPSFKVLPLPVLVLVMLSCWLLHSRRAEAQVSLGHKVRDLQELRLATLRDLVKTTRQHFTNGLASSDDLWSAIKAREGAELDLCGSDQERIAVLEKAVAEARMLEERDAKLAANKLASETRLLKARAERLQQEILLEQARAHQ